MQTRCQLDANRSSIPTSRLLSGIECEYTGDSPGRESKPGCVLFCVCPGLVRCGALHCIALPPLSCLRISLFQTPDSTRSFTQHRRLLLSYIPTALLSAELSKNLSPHKQLPTGAADTVFLRWRYIRYPRKPRYLPAG